jgi:5-methylcytosine-specific restriction endonuclease McrBC regulatory subunit McrC
LAGALTEVRDQSFLRTARSKFTDTATELEIDPQAHGDEVDLARLATVILLQRGFDLESGGPNTPRAWFIDLETLFERAVRHTLKGLLAPFEVDKGASVNRRIFFPGADEGLANPDLVVRQGRRVHAVGDVKYKSLDETEGNDSKRQSRADLYQLLVHASALGSTKAFLVYPAEDRYLARHHGDAATGADTWTFAVRPQSLVDDLEAVVDHLVIRELPSRGGGKQVAAAAMHALAE